MSTGKIKDPYYLRFVVIAFLIALTLLPYGQVRQHAFVDLDDYDYIVDNPNVKYGFSVAGVVWALGFSDQDRSYWRPLTWLTHMLDFELFGADAGSHHLINLMLHLINVLLLYGFLYKTTGSVGRSAAAAALFGVHPINVECVAWVTERSSLLSTGLGLLTLIQYAAYARRPSRKHYALTMMAYLLCLMAKPILVTLPFLMLLLDYWPFRRIDLVPRTGDQNAFPRTEAGQALPRLRITTSHAARSIAGLIVEKVPFLGMTIGAILFSILRFGTTVSVDHVPFPLRMANAIVSYLKYLGNLFYPVNLAAFYPFPPSIPSWQVVTSLLLLLLVTLYLIINMRRWKYLLVGWLWFIGTLVPKIGLVQAGLWPALADRWAYFPAIGLFIGLVWWVADGLAGKSKAQIRGTAMAALVLLGILANLAWRQVGYWADSTTLFEHMLATTTDNYMAHHNLGFVLLKEDRLEAAAWHFKRAIAIAPEFEPAVASLGTIAKKRGRHAEAVRWYKNAMAINPHYSVAYLNLGNLYFDRGEFHEAIRYFSKGIKVEPRSSLLYNSLGAALTKTGRLEEAVICYRKALQIDPGLKIAAMNLDAVEAALKRSAPD
ncbi:MAG: tetratricopeptide repeat protein [Desulfobacterales bacterium]